MNKTLRQIAIADYDYPLPDDRIARYPLAERDHSKLLSLVGGILGEHHFYDLPSLLPKNTLMVFNDTKVIHARLRFRKATGATIEIFCLEPYAMPVAQAFEQREHCTWLCLVGNNKRWRNDTLSMPLPPTAASSAPTTLFATRKEAVGDAWLINFAWSGGLSFAEVIEQAGSIPLPPYLGREAEASDSTRYQTVYAHYEGSVAAPTAGLHFTPTLLDSLQQQGIQTEYITLHVGAGTFKPVGTPTIGGHEMHTEKVQISADNLQHLIAHFGKPIIAVGTTTVRTLESLYWFGTQLMRHPECEKMHVAQWEPYEAAFPLPSPSEAYAAVVHWMERHGLSHLDGETQLLIAPGYQYRVVNGLVTNFHQPRSTLLLLVAALIGDRWHECYRYALDHQFRFLSYGDSCLFIP